VSAAARYARNPVKALLLGMVRGYQTFVSPGMPRRCKYHPTCSQYAVDALTQYGVLRGVVLAGWRLLRCNPLSYGGYDPVERQRVFAPRPDDRRVARRRSAGNDTEPASPSGGGRCCDHAGAV